MQFSYRIIDVVYAKEVHMMDTPKVLDEQEEHKVQGHFRDS